MPKTALSNLLQRFTEARVKDGLEDCDAHFKRREDGAQLARALTVPMVQQRAMPAVAQITDPASVRTLVDIDSYSQLGCFVPCSWCRPLSRCDACLAMHLSATVLPAVATLRTGSARARTPAHCIIVRVNLKTVVEACLHFQLLLARGWMLTLGTDASRKELQR